MGRTIAGRALLSPWPYGHCNNTPLSTLHCPTPPPHAQPAHLAPFNLESNEGMWINSGCFQQYSNPFDLEHVFNVILTQNEKLQPNLPVPSHQSCSPSELWELRPSLPRCCDGCENNSAWKSSIRRFVITEKAPTRAFSWLKAATTTFTFKTLLRHYANGTLTHGK